MTKVYNEEFTGALREIVQRVPFFNSPYGKDIVNLRSIENLYETRSNAEMLSY